MGTILSHSRASKIMILAVVLLALWSPAVVHAAAAEMKDYCQVPPFIGVTRPNLLLFIDNSASMFDLSFDDRGMKHCSNSAMTCTLDSECPGGTCSVVDRKAHYCYDETYSTTKPDGTPNIYDGYFNPSLYYQYDLANDIFTEVAGFSCVGSGLATEKTKQITSPTNQLCVIFDTARPSGDQVTKFLASGNYLNWLSASKFDIEKQVLTGGKYVTKLCSNDKTKACTVNGDCSAAGVCTPFAPGPFLMAESRGCVGQEFIKDAITGDFVNYSDAGTDTNPSLGLTFTVTGPQNPYNIFALSPGGQTYIHIYAKSGGTPYNYYACQQAVQAVNSGTNAEIKKWVDLCLATANKPGKCQLENAISCNSSLDCGLDLTQPLTASICSAATNITCAATADCQLPAGNFCSLRKSLSCNPADPNTCKRSIPALAGRCTDVVFSYIGQNGKNPEKPAQIKTAGNVCTADSQCSFDNYVAQPGACTGLVPAHEEDYGSCDPQVGFDGGTCVANNVGPCVVPANEAAVKTKVVFMQALQECWSIRPASSHNSADQYGFSNMNTIKQMCPDIYASYKACSNNTMRQCTADIDCGAGNTCKEGPEAIGPGNPAILCGLEYAGVCFEKVGGVWKEKGTCEDWDHGGDPRFNSLAYNEWRFCGAMDDTTPEVVDPTVEPSDTTLSGNLPPILSSISVVAQMGLPLRSNIAVRVSRPTAPTGVVQEFGSIIRMGLLSFNTFGSSSESGALGAKKVCSNDGRVVCTSALDCGGGAATCNVAPDHDGGQILSYIGQGRCSSSFSTLCQKSSPDCPVGEVCVFSGDHNSGMTNAIDSLRAATWTPHAEGFYNAIGYYAGDTSRRINDLLPTDFDFTTNPRPSQSNCQKNNVLLLTDGQATADLNAEVSGTITSYSGLFSPAPNYDTAVNNACTPYSGSRNIEPLAWLAHNRDITNNFAGPVAPATTLTNNKIINTYVVYTGSGSMDTTTCANTLVADLQTQPQYDSCDADIRMCKTARYGGGRYYLAQDPAKLKRSLKDAFIEIAAKATSGTAASVLASGEGSGANLIQALFYPRRTFFNNTETLWAGSLQNLWYFVDPFFAKSNIREDTNPNKVLDLTDDYIVRLYFNNAPAVNRVQVERKVDSDGDGTPESLVTPDIDIENIASLWESGMQLWARTSARNIYTDCSINSTNCLNDAGGNSTKVMYFTPANFDTLTRQRYLQAAGAAEAANIINFTHGTFDGDGNTYRKRTVTIDVDKDGAVDAGETQVWKLGDVLNSTPKIASWMPLNTYNRVYGDPTYGLPFQELNPSDGDSEGAFITSRTSYPQYRNRGMVFAGANDGMLHAFRLGTLQLKWTGQSGTQHARLLRTCSKSATVCTADADCGADTCPQLGQEMWAFIPKNALPYLKYMADSNYCHVYTVDLTPFIFDASIEGPDSTCADRDGSYWNCTRTKDSWRTILIGGMRYGGACKARVCSLNPGKECDDVATFCGVGEGTCGNPSADTIGTPILDPADNTKGLGYSSYFALDVTESLADASKPPRLMWEFSHEELGLTSAAPAVVRIRASTDATAPGTKDGRFYVVLGSGPTGTISDTQLLGRSNQPLKLFVLDLKTGAMATAAPIDSGIDNAFTGSMLNATFDSDLDYQDDVVYFGYVKKAGLASTWTDGGVGRLLTNGNLNPGNWEFSKVIDGIGPVTTAVSKLQNNKTQKLWLYFGTGRYIYKTSTESDDNTTRRTLFGITDPCYKSGSPAPTGPFPSTCVGVTRAVGDLNNATVESNAQADGEGWRVDMADVIVNADATKSLGTERVITDPLATSTGLVFFTTFAPYSEICTLGGKSYVWAMKYDTAEAPGAMLKGKALVQVSTGSIEQVDMQTMFTEEGGRRTAAMEGVPPTAQGLSIISSPPPVKRVLHMKER